MKIERTKNATRNIIFGVVLKIYQILMPFLVRTVMIYCMGVQYLGLSSLFTSILQVLNLAELGVGSAMVYSMYQPIAEDNKKKICALMKLYKMYYRVIGLVIAVIGIILLPFIPSLIKGSLPSGVNLYILYILNLSATVLSYWLFAYKNSLLIAHQRIDISSKVILVINTIQYLLQFVILWLFHSYYLYLIVALVAQAGTNIVTSIIVSKMYPEYRAIGDVKKEIVDDINQKIKDLFTSKVGAVIVNSADSIVISAFLGLTELAIYQNYYYILTSIIGMITIIFNSCMAGIGNSLIVETKQKNYKDFEKFTFLIAWISGFCACCLLCLYQPFMKIWVGEKLQLQFTAVICLVIYYFVYEINQLLNMYKDASGIWHKDRFRTLATALTNLGLNLIMVQFWGIYGVLFSTVLSTLIVGMPWLLNNLFTCIFDIDDLKRYVLKLLKYTGVTFIACSCSLFICSYLKFGDWETLFARGIVCCIIPNCIFFLIYHKTVEFLEAVILVDRITKGKFKVLKYILEG